MYEDLYTSGGNEIIWAFGIMDCVLGCWHVYAKKTSKYILAILTYVHTGLRVHRKIVHSLTQMWRRRRRFVTCKSFISAGRPLEHFSLTFPTRRDYSAKETRWGSHGRWGGRCTFQSQAQTNASGKAKNERRKNSRLVSGLGSHFSTHCRRISSWPW